MRNLNKKLPVVKAIKPKTKVNIQCEDNLEYMRSLRKSSMHLIVTSPPYNIGKDTWDKITNYNDFMISVIKLLETKLKDNGSFLKIVSLVISQ